MNVKHTAPYLGSILLAAVVGLGCLAATPASAATPAPEPPTPSPTTVALAFVGFNAARAAQYGYSVRTTAQGYQYAVPAANALGDMTGSTPLFDPITKSVVGSSAASSRANVVVPDGSVTNNCGTAWVYFNNSPAQIRTGYLSNPLWGQPLWRNWNVAVHSPYDLHSIPFSGIATPGFYWQAYAYTDLYARKGNKVSAVAGGTITTVLGDCVVLAPAAVATE